MKLKITAFLLLVGLVTASLSPVWAGYFDRSEIQNYCVVGFYHNGEPIYDFIVTDCVYNPMRSCLPDIRPCWLDFQ